MRLFPFLIVFFISAPFSWCADTVRDSLDQLITDAPTEAKKGEHMCDLAWHLRDSDPEETMRLCEQLTQMDITDKVRARSLNIIGVIHQQKGDYDLAVDHFLRALRLDEKIDNQAGQASCLNNLGNVYFHQREFAKAIEYFQRALAINRASDDLEGVAGNLNNIGGMYLYLGDTEAAISHFEQGLEINRQINFKPGIAFGLGNLGTVYLGLDETDKALDYFKQSAALDQQGDKQRQLATAYYNMGTVYFRKMQLDSALAYYGRSEEVATRIKAREILKGLYGNFAEVYEKKGELEIALRYERRHAELKDSLLDEARIRQVGELDKKYETEKKDQALALSEQQNRVKDLKLKEEQLLRNGIVIGAILLLLVSFLLYNRARLKREQARLVEKQALLDKINQQKENLFHAVVDAQESERRRVAAELHDGVGGLLSAVRMNLEMAKEKIGSETHQPLVNSIAMVDEACEDVRTLSHSMMPSVLVKLGLVASLKEFIAHIEKNSAYAITFNCVGLDTRLDQSIETVVYRIVQEAISNINKHANAKQVSIDLKANDSELLVSIQDDGIGFTPDPEKAGIGLQNLESRVAHVKGNFSINSTLGKGTQIDVRIPLTS